MEFTLIETINMFIEELEGDLEDLSWQIREETNFSDNNIDFLSNECDEKAKHLENLKEIKSILQNK
jgi:hypothetical protein